MEALRRRLADVLDVEELAALKAKAAQFDSIAGELPAWKQQIADAVDQQRQEGEQHLQRAQEQLSRAKIEQQATASFIDAGGRAEAWAVFSAAALNNLHQGEDGAILCGDKPLQDAIKIAADDPTFAGMFRARYGAGGGSRSGTHASTVIGPNLARMSTEEKFRAAFGRR